MFDQIRTKWGRLDILVYSIAFAPKSDLQGGLLNCSAEGFAKAMDISCHSFIRMAKLQAPADDRRRDHVRYGLLRREQGGRELQCDGSGQGSARGGVPRSGLRTRSAGYSCSRDVSGSVEDAGSRRPEGLRALAHGSCSKGAARGAVDIMDVGFTCAYLATPFGKRITGGTVYVDGGATSLPEPRPRQVETRSALPRRADGRARFSNTRWPCLNPLR